MKRVIEEEICCFGPYSEDGAVSVDLKAGLEMTPVLEKKSIQTRYILISDGNRLVMKSPDLELILFDSARNEWKAPMIGSPGMPKEGTCRVISKKWMPFRGEDRLVVVVECSAYLEGKRIYDGTWTLASGLGIIALDDFVLTSVEQADGPPPGRE
jgi:hypothetical protein